MFLKEIQPRQQERNQEILDLEYELQAELIFQESLLDDEAILRDFYSSKIDFDNCPRSQLNLGLFYDEVSGTVAVSAILKGHLKASHIVYTQTLDLEAKELHKAILVAVYSAFEYIGSEPTKHSLIDDITLIVDLGFQRFLNQIEIIKPTNKNRFLSMGSASYVDDEGKLLQDEFYSCGVRYIGKSHNQLRKLDNALQSRELKCSRKIKGSLDNPHLKTASALCLVLT